MAKLVLLSQGLIGRTHELKVDTTTIGRVDDNTFPIAEPSVSSHHCEILRKGSEHARATAAQTLGEVRHAMRIDYFDDKELIAEQARQYQQQR